GARFRQQTNPDRLSSVDHVECRGNRFEARLDAGASSAFALLQHSRYRRVSIVAKQSEHSPDKRFTTEGIEDDRPHSRDHYLAERDLRAAGRAKSTRRAATAPR